MSRKSTRKPCSRKSAVDNATADVNEANHRLLEVWGQADGNSMLGRCPAGRLPTSCGRCAA